MTKNEYTILSHSIPREEEIGVWTEDMSIIQNIVDDDDDLDREDDLDEDEYDDHYDDYINEPDYNEYEDSNYSKYRGTYAQDVMGYSDDDIDTIFDGDPDAYWNID